MSTVRPQPVPRHAPRWVRWTRHEGVPARAASLDGACAHEPRCPSADAVDRDAARTVRSHPEQGWSLLCNGVVAFDDAGDLLPDGRAVAPRRLAAAA